MIYRLTDETGFKFLSREWNSLRLGNLNSDNVIQAVPYSIEVREGSFPIQTISDASSDVFTFAILQVLIQNPQLSFRNLEEALGVTASAIDRSLNFLLSNAVIERTRHGTYRRTVYGKYNSVTEISLLFPRLLKQTWLTYNTLCLRDNDLVIIAKQRSHERVRYKGEIHVPLRSIHRMSPQDCIEQTLLRHQDVRENAPYLVRDIDREVRGHSSKSVALQGGAFLVEIGDRQEWIVSIPRIGLQHGDVKQMRSAITEVLGLIQ